jgi:hypothetical protein
MPKTAPDEIRFRKHSRVFFANKISLHKLGICKSFSLGGGKIEKLKIEERKREEQRQCQEKKREK